MTEEPLFTNLEQGFCIIEKVATVPGEPSDFRYVAANPAFEAHTGLRDVVGKTIRELVPTAEDAIMDRYDEVVATGASQRFEAHVEALDLWMEAEVFAAGEPNRIAVLFSNVSVRKRVETALRESEERFREFGEASQDVLWTRDAETLCWTYLSAGFERVYGAKREDALSNNTMENWLELIVPEDRIHALENIRKVREGKRVAFEYRVRRPDGTIRWIRNTDFPMRDAAGKVVRIGGVGADITALKRGEEHQAMLLSELQHRVRNTLAIVRSIARRTAENSTSVDDMLGHFQGRLDAFSRVQAALTRSADGGVDLRSLIDDELIAHAAHEGDDVHVSGPDVILDGKSAERLSLAIHELTTNAVKHGALSGGLGKLSVQWERKGADGSGEQLVLRWNESEVDLSDRPADADGFGMELLRRSLPYDLQAETEVELTAGGLRFRLEMPLREPAKNVTLVK